MGKFLDRYKRKIQIKRQIVAYHNGGRKNIRLTSRHILVHKRIGELVNFMVKYVDRYKRKIQIKRQIVAYHNGGRKNISLTSRYILVHWRIGALVNLAISWGNIWTDIRERYRLRDRSSHTIMEDVRTFA